LVSSFLELLYSLRVRQGGEDRIYWISSKRRKFEVRSYYHVLYIHASSHFLWKSICRVKVPSRVAFFEWTAALGKILILNNLRKRNVIVMDWCCICKKSGESTDHLLLHYEVARDLWSSLFHLFRADWVMPRRVKELLVSWSGQVRSCNVLTVWRLYLERAECKKLWRKRIRW